MIECKLSLKNLACPKTGTIEVGPKGPKLIKSDVTSVNYLLGPKNPEVHKLV